MAETKTTKKKWKDVFLDNYNGTSDEAKSIEDFMKKTYKGDAYIPWATMERLTYMLDDDAEFKNILNNEGGLVHSDIVETYQQNIQKGEVVSETKAQMFSHFVKVQLTFMGKIFVEEYPIQDQDYSAAKIFNQNMVNKALQRAKAKVAARATGLGLKLYEGKDLQFEDKAEPTKPELPKVEVKKEEPKKVETKVVETKVEEPKVEVKVEEPKVETVEITGVVKEIIDLIRTSDKEKMEGALQRVNVALTKKYGKAIKIESSDEEIASIISGCFTDPSQLLKTLNNLIG